ncbi:MAG TPA: hypothetical protein VEQ16_05930 [Acidocella sp.]|nr:hypothetical protein [Acidocella sp.]
MARNADMARFLERLSPSLATSFSHEQLAAIELHFSMRNRAEHVVDWRREFRIGRLRGYVVVLAGRVRAGE